MKTVTLITDYDVGQKQVRLSIVVGDGQIGSSVVKLGKKLIAKGDIDKVLLGSGAQLRGKTLFVKSVVADVNDQTNHTSLTHQFRGGAGNQDFVSQASVEQDGDSVIYRAKFNLI